MYELARFGLFSRQSATLTIGLNIGCSHGTIGQMSNRSSSSCHCETKLF